MGLSEIEKEILLRARDALELHADQRQALVVARIQTEGAQQAT